MSHTYGQSYHNSFTAALLIVTVSLVVSPLVITTGVLGAVVVIVMVAVPLLIGCTWSVVLFVWSLYNSKHDATLAACASESWFIINSSHCILHIGEQAGQSGRNDILLIITTVSFGRMFTML